jgi:homeobox protein cut-like
MLIYPQELRKHYHTISELRTEVKSLQSDNLKLYEKVRYMQSYREQGSVSQLDPLPPSSSSAFNGNRSGNGGGGGRDELGKWRARYEEAMNPFEAFRGRVCVKRLAFLCAGLMIVKIVCLSGSNACV